MPPHANRLEAQPPLVKGARRKESQERFLTLNRNGPEGARQDGGRTAAGNWMLVAPGAHGLRRKPWGFIAECNERAEPADKPGFVVDSHSSRRYVTAALKQPTRTRRGPRH